MHNRRTFGVLASLLLSCTVAIAQEPSPYVPDSAITRGKHFVEMLSQGNSAGCLALFDSTMTAALPASKLREI